MGNYSRFCSLQFVVQMQQYIWFLTGRMAENLQKHVSLPLNILYYVQRSGETNSQILYIIFLKKIKGHFGKHSVGICSFKHFSTFSLLIQMQEATLSNRDTNWT